MTIARAHLVDPSVTRWYHCATRCEKVKGDGHQIWRTQGVQVNGASLRLFLRSSTGPNRAFEPQSLGRVRDPVRIAEGPTAIDAVTQRRHFGFRLRLVDKLQPIGVGSGRGHPLCGTWETWMAPNVMGTWMAPNIFSDLPVAATFSDLLFGDSDADLHDWLRQCGNAAVPVCMSKTRRAMKRAA